jgi:hypothetical protein
VPSHESFQMCKKNVIFCGGIEYGIFVATEVANAIDSLSLESWGSQLDQYRILGEKEKKPSQSCYSQSCAKTSPFHLIIAD